MSGEGEMRGRLFKVFLQGGVRRIRPFRASDPLQGECRHVQMPTALAAAVGSAVLTDMDSEIAVLEKKVEKYRQFKSGMMSELLTGKVRLTEGK